MNVEKELHLAAQRIRALSQNGLVYSTNEYDTERYQELLELSNRITAIVSGNDVSTIAACFRVEDDYVTPKVDIRAVVFDDKGRILLVRERADGLWSLPGGWSDIGFSSSEVAVKEVKEETGLDVVPVKLLAVLDKQRHNHPPAAHYAYKVFILCRTVGGEFNTAFDILDKDFFGQDNLPSLSTDRILKEQIDLMFDFRNNPDKEPIVD
ncbi:ADP-ribose pyrophosphatase YjhB (NUDIX family) [Dysgonomonas sp. PH5-45]|uniref:NUDIX hydrolase n=1 Tax=unclassified Dysgonomonas TaxID=2630389 RepID=UPI0024740EB0|nr:MULTISPECIES: NUDIX hydrolase [unclassified Dysgonomonas]MDH6354646.1 ADP-ribose pyrophosphatase YjhB (NUDIX family) [Dysgonomonas sp. PH5-45]MDH6387544.1 ADP-ribose pyrophosphatase YjhB (NUDIX family) [Dysgonomonas sp. PH5-37]